MKKLRIDKQVLRQWNHKELLAEVESVENTLAQLRDEITRITTKNKLQIKILEKSRKAMREVLDEPQQQETYWTCTSCGKQDETVFLRTCGYSADVHDDPDDWETVCDDCEEQHCLDI